MSYLKPIRPSTDLIGKTLYQGIAGPTHSQGLAIVSSKREIIGIDFDSLSNHGLAIHPDYLEKVRDGFRLIIPPKLPTWSPSSVESFAGGGITPITLRNHFNDIRSFIAEYVWLPDPVSYQLFAVAVFLSYLVCVFPAIAMIEIVGDIGSGKSTLFHLLSRICRSGIYSSVTTVAGFRRARHLNPSTLLIDEALRNPGHPAVLASYKNGPTQLMAGSGHDLFEQNLYGLTFKVRDHASEAVKDRTIFIDIAPASRPMPPFLPERESERVSRLVDHSLWLSLTQFQNVMSEYESYIRESSYLGRTAEKWAPILAIARSIDSSDSDQKPIAPDLEAMMAEQVADQKNERSATDPSLLALAGTLAYLERHDADLESTSALVVASDLAGFVSEFAEAEMLPQRVSSLLGVTGVVSRTSRTRDTSECVHPVSNKHPKTIYRIDLPKLKRALELNGIKPKTQTKERNTANETRPAK